MSQDTETDEQQMQPFVDKDKKKELEDEEDESDEKGNVWGVKLFTANLAILILLYIAAFSYTYGVIRMIEKKFAFSSLKTGMIMTMTDIMNLVLVIFVGYIGQRVHKPRVISFSMGLIALAMIFCFGGPYFYFREVSPVELTSINNVTIEGKPRLCSFLENANETVSSSECHSAETPVSEESSSTYLVFILGAVLCGIGGVAPFPLGFVFIDENVPKKDSAAYIGVALGAFPIGPLIGFSMAAVFTRLPEDLKDYKGMDPRDPRFIGAWWLGFVIIGILMLLFCIPMCFFQKHYEIYYIRKNKRGKKPRKLVGNSLKRNVKEFISSIWRLFSNATLSLLILSKVAGMYLIQLIVNQPRYVEANFHIPAYTANIISAGSGAFSSAIGSIAAGFVMKKMKMGPISMIKSYIVAIVLVSVGILVMMFISCDELQIAGYDGKSLDLGGTCNEDCGCETRFEPVCGSDGQTHFSACHAGCQNFDENTFSNCGCIMEGNGTTTRGTCEQTCGPQLIAYASTYFLWSLLSAFGKVAGTVVLLRIVAPELKPLAFSLNSFFYNLLGFIPAPMIYGSIIDSTCLIWQQTCDGGKGGCQLYKTTDLRLLLHGVTLALQVLSLLFGFGVWLSARGKKFTEEDESKIQKENKIYRN